MSTDSAVTVDLDRPRGDRRDAPASAQLVRHRGASPLLADAVLGLDDEPECRAVVLCSEGKNFCAGADLSGSDLLDHTARLYHAGGAHLLEPRSRSSPRCRARPSAAASGSRSRPTSASRPPRPASRCNFARLGFHQGFGISVTLPAVVGQQRALELMYTGGSTCAARRRIASVSPTASSPADELRAAARGVRDGDRDIGAAGLARRSARPCAATSPSACARATAREKQRAAASARHRRLPRGRRGDRRAAAAELHGPVAVTEARADRDRPATRSPRWAAVALPGLTAPFRAELDRRRAVEHHRAHDRRRRTRARGAPPTAAQRAPDRARHGPRAPHHPALGADAAFPSRTRSRTARTPTSSARRST